MVMSRTWGALLEMVREATDLMITWGKVVGRGWEKMRVISRLPILY